MYVQCVAGKVSKALSHNVGRSSRHQWSEIAVFRCDTALVKVTA